MEQGTQKVTDDPDFAKAAGRRSATGSASIEQGNLGGSGGFARAPARDRSRPAPSTYVLCLDDDVVCEPEGDPARGHLRRPGPPPDDRRRPHVQPLLALAAAQLRRDRRTATASGGCRRPTVQHRLGLRRPQPALDALAAPPHRRRLQRLVHVPDPARRCCARSACALPLFIKWDDSEFGVRAQEAGYPTVTFPGAAVWHVPWTDKNDALDWQSYFHQRNRFVAALLHSPYERGGRMVRESLNHQVKHLVSMQYSTVELRHQALEDVLRRSGGSCTATWPTKLGRDPRARASRSPTRSCRPTPTRSRRCAGRSRRARARTAPRSRAGCRQLRHRRPRRRCGSCGRPATLSREYPEAELPAMDAKWYRLAALRLRGRLDARRHLGRALPARPGRSSATCSSAPSRSTSGCTASGRELAERYREQPGRRSPRRRPGPRPSSIEDDP